MSIRSFSGITPQIATTAYIDEAAMVIGDVQIGEQSSVWPSTVIRGDVEKIRIGASSNIQDGSVLHVSHDSEYAPGGKPLLIGDGVTVGHKVILHGCTVQDYVLVGMGAIVLDGAILESEVMLGAGSLVSPGKVLEGGYLWLGSPAKRVRPLSDKERAFLRYSAEHYQRLKDRY